MINIAEHDFEVHRDTLHYTPYNDVDRALLSKFRDRIAQTTRYPAILWDIGSGVGLFALAALYNTDTVVHCFEPGDAHEILVSNLFLLDPLMLRWEAWDLALMDKHGSGIMSIPESKLLSGFSTLGEDPRLLQEKYYEKPVEITTVDDVVASGCSAPTVMKIDVEGAEKFVLLGAQNTIRESHPDIMVEVCDRNTVQFDYLKEDIISILDGFGYEWYWFTKDDIWATYPES